MQITTETAGYLAAATRMLMENPDRLARWASEVCSECCEDVSEASFEETHLYFRAEDGSLVVLVGCEGYWMLSPATLGIDRPNWQDWMTELETDAKL